MFTDFTQEEVLERVKAMWTIEEDDMFPLPKFKISCPICGSEDILARSWHFHVRDVDSKTKYRCDVSFKCTNCSFVWVHGVVGINV